MVVRIDIDGHGIYSAKIQIFYNLTAKFLPKILSHQHHFIAFSQFNCEDDDIDR